MKKKSREQRNTTSKRTQSRPYVRWEYFNDARIQCLDQANRYKTRGVKSRGKIWCNVVEAGVLVRERDDPSDKEWNGMLLVHTMSAFLNFLGRFEIRKDPDGSLLSSNG